MDENGLVSQDVRERLDYPLRETGFHKFVVAVLRYIFNLFMVIEVRGLSHLPAQGGVVLCANHTNNFDIFPLQLALPRMLFYMGKAELFKQGFIHYAFRNLGAFPVHRGARDEWALRHARRILDAGQVLAMFPEGTRNRGKGLQVAKTGAARLAIESGCPIVPVAIVGIQDLFRHFPRRAHIVIEVCAPIWTQVNDTPLDLTERLMFTLAAHLPEALRGVYAKIPPAFKPQP